MVTHHINLAIRDCLDQCYVSENPLSSVADFIARLRSDPQWNDTDIEQVENSVRRILKAVVVGQQGSATE